MAVGAIQTRLVDKSLRCDANIIVETASARESIALRSCSASARPLSIRTSPMKRWRSLVDSKAIDKAYRAVMLNYRNGINKGLYKIAPKMGISTMRPTAARSCSKPSVCI